MALLTLQALSHDFGNGRLGLQDINCTIDQGELIALVGQNGAGKSLLAQHLCGLRHPTSGALYIEKATQVATPHALRMLCGMVFQQAEHQIVGQSVIEDLLFGLRNIGMERVAAQECAQRQLEQLHIAHLRDRHPESLSGGELRRVALASMLVMRPRLLILDEPFAHLDWKGIVDLHHIIKALQREGHTILLLTHELNKLPKSLARVIILHQGAKYADGSPQECQSAAQKLGLLPPIGAYYASPRPANPLLQ